MYDEDIAKPTVQAIESSGEKGKHAIWDLGFPQGIEDDAMLEKAKKLKKTLITGNVKHFWNLPNLVYKESYGVWMFNSVDPHKIGEQFKQALKSTGMRTRQLRKNKKVLVSSNEVTVVDCSTGKSVKFNYEGQKKKKG
jgi:hypothetical protein